MKRKVDSQNMGSGIKARNAKLIDFDWVLTNHKWSFLGAYEIVGTEGWGRCYKCKSTLWPFDLFQNIHIQFCLKIFIWLWFCDQLVPRDLIRGVQTHNLISLSVLVAYRRSVVSVVNRAYAQARATPGNLQDFVTHQRPWEDNSCSSLSP